LVDVLRRWSRLGPELVVMTRGSEGCAAETRSGLTEDLAGVKVDVVDTIGAGDSFESGLLSAVADEGLLEPATLGRLSSAQLARILQRAVAVAAITCGRAGADPPTREEYEAVAG
jgi:fructokinase